MVEEVLYGKKFRNRKIFNAEHKGKYYLKWTKDKHYSYQYVLGMKVLDHGSGAARNYTD